jgi:hypothetical protein
VAAPQTADWITRYTDRFYPPSERLDASLKVKTDSQFNNAFQNLRRMGLAPE